MGLRVMSTTREASPVAPLANASRAIFGESKKHSNDMGSSAVSANSNSETSVGANSSAEKPVDEYGNAILYRGHQNSVVKLLFGASSFNFFYWTYYSVNAWYYDGVLVQGVQLGGDIRWGVLGGFATGLMFYATKVYKDNSCMMAYLVKGKEGSGEADRLGFQMHNFFGGPGRRIEVNSSNVRLVDKDSQESARFGSSFLPIRVKGLSKNVLIDDKGDFYYNGKFRQILFENQAVPVNGGASASEKEIFLGDIDSKERRKNMLAEQKRNNKQR